MLHSQTRAGSQFPEKHKGTSYTPRRAHMATPDITDISTGMLRTIINSPFAFPEYAAKFEALVSQAMQQKDSMGSLPLFNQASKSTGAGLQQGDYHESRKAKTEYLLAAMIAWLGSEGKTTLEISVEFDLHQKTINTYMKRLVKAGRVQRVAKMFGDRPRAAYVMRPATT